MKIGGGEKQTTAAMGKCDTVAQYTHQVEANMATMVATGGIAVVLRIVDRQPGSGILFRKDRVAIVRPRRAES